MHPDLSIVATSRNDNHGGDLCKRMQIFIDGIVAQSKKYNFSVELILVEWNPPIDKPGLYEVLKWPRPTSPCSIRIIEVPAEVHNRYKYSSGLPLFQMIAKNAGIVRANSNFILSTNIDIIFSDELMNSLSSKTLREGNYYRANRYDVSRDVYKYNKSEDLLSACSRHTVRINHRNGIKDCTSGEATEFYPDSPTIPYMGKRRKYIPGWNFIVQNPDHQYVRLIYKMLRQYRNWLRLHTNACGDFTMMSKADWEKIRGAPELELFSLHLDSLVCYIAHFAGIKEVVLDAPIYHIDHDSGWTLEVEKDRSLYKRLEKNKVPVMSIKELDKWIATMHRNKSPIIYNNEDWGLANVDLKETVIN